MCLNFIPYLESYYVLILIHLFLFILSIIYFYLFLIIRIKLFKMFIRLLVLFFFICSFYLFNINLSWYLQYIWLNNFIFLIYVSLLFNRETYHYCLNDEVFKYIVNCPSISRKIVYFLLFNVSFFFSTFLVFILYYWFGNVAYSFISQSYHYISTYFSIYFFSLDTIFSFTIYEYFNILFKGLSKLSMDIFTFFFNFYLLESFYYVLIIYFIVWFIRVLRFVFYSIFIIFNFYSYPFMGKIYCWKYKFGSFYSFFWTPYSDVIYFLRFQLYQILYIYFSSDKVVNTELSSHISSLFILIFNEFVMLVCVYVDLWFRRIFFEYSLINIITWVQFIMVISILKFFLDVFFPSIELMAFILIILVSIRNQAIRNEVNYRSIWKNLLCANYDVNASVSNYWNNYVFLKKLVRGPYTGTIEHLLLNHRKEYSLLFPYDDSIEVLRYDKGFQTKNSSGKYYNLVLYEYSFIIDETFIAKYYFNIGSILDAYIEDLSVVTWHRNFRRWFYKFMN